MLTPIAAHFDKGAPSYVDAALLQRQVAGDLCQHLPLAPIGTLLDLGCGPGWLHPRLQQSCHQLIAADLSPAMLAQAQQVGLAQHFLCADASALPLASASVDLVFSSLMLQWCAQPEAVFSEVARVLRPGGTLLLTTLVEGSLAEFRQSWHQVDSDTHHLPFAPAQRIGAAVTQAGLTLQAQQLRYVVHYPDVRALARGFKQLGANYVQGRQRQGLSGKGRWAQWQNAYEPFRTDAGLPLSYEVLQLVARKSAPLTPTNKVGRLRTNPTHHVPN